MPEDDNRPRGRAAAPPLAPEPSAARPEPSPASTALVPARPDTALARPMIARDLDKAGKGQLVYVGRDGEVKDPAGVRSRQVLAYVTFGAITAAGVALAATSFPLLIPFYAVLGGRFFGTVRAVGQVNQASVALSNGDAATGRALAEPVTRAWWTPGRVRALASMRVAIADALEGHPERALDRVRAARARLSPRLIQFQFSFYTECNLLIVLGRLKEARSILELRGGVPQGEVLKLSYWLAQMHLGVAENKLEIDESELHDRMRKGLSMTAGRDLLLLCAWAHARRGDHDDARFAWREAMQREGSQRLDIAMPTLAAWVTEYRAAHPTIDDPDPDDEL
ncbi:MAG: hypothetical protein NT062_12890 [Proteobacteria bacterium]|nr:hypothetical protein [Pseudomonadota bacterium]